MFSCKTVPEYLVIVYYSVMPLCHSSITVVQSYFVYWAGIDSAVVHDGSRSPWIGSNITKVDEENSDFVLQQDEALPGMQFVKL